MAVSEREVWRLLRQIEMRELFLDPHTPVPITGCVQYDVSNGYSLAVAVHDGRWAHLDWVCAPKDTVALHYPTMSSLLQAYIPTTETQRNAFGFLRAVPVP